MEDTAEETFPKIISVDDHVIEHSNVWLDRLPAKYHDVGPRTVQERGTMAVVGGTFSYEPSEDGDTPRALVGVEYTDLEMRRIKVIFTDKAINTASEHPVVHRHR